MKTIMVKTYSLMMLAIVLTSCRSSEIIRNRAATWQQAQASIEQSARAGEYQAIAEQFLAPELIQQLIRKHGEDGWIHTYQKETLESIPFYFKWLKNSDVERSGDNVLLRGQHGCYATFVNVDGRYYLLDVGQHITSM
ncbi:MAG: hypothetical protein ISS35_03380 [Kiritimatiellae bacterium]|nr:hypothetical protein [Kiritimatiellia bacterium]